VKRTPYVRLIASGGLIGIVLAGVALRYGGEALVVSRPVEEPSVIVALASHEWERLPVAAQLGRRYTAAQILLTLPTHITEHRCYECSERVDWLAEAGIDRDRVVVLPQPVANTHDEAQAAAAFAARHRIDRLVIVTSPYHARRALATFRHLFGLAGVQVDIGLATPSGGVDPRHWWLRDYDRRYAVYEWAAIAYYAVRYGVSPVV
jgi:uncharacterized SAM-binding protein YcdF (DUF218 family)